MQHIVRVGVRMDLCSIQMWTEPIVRQCLIVWWNKMYRLYVALFLIFLGISSGAFATVCDDGQATVNRAGGVVPKMDCGDDVYLGVADTDSFPGIACAAKSSKLATSSGVSVSVYSSKYTSPSLGVLFNGNVCYVNLVSGNSSGLNIMGQDGAAYHAQDLSLCMTLQSSDPVEIVRSNENTVNWASSLGENTVKGISYCSDQSASIADVQSVLSFVSYDVENLNCWCRAVSPVVSDWLYAMEFASEVNCNKYCAARCAEIFVEDSNFRSVMLRNVYRIN